MMILSVVWILICFVVSTDSSYSVYTYANHGDSTERCCFVRRNEQFCRATPLTSRLLLLTPQCQSTQSKKKSGKYLDEIVRRLNVQNKHQIGRKLLLQLENPLDKEILDNDLLCLSSAENNHFRLDQCYLEVKNRSSGNYTQIQLAQPVTIHRGQGLSLVQNYQLNVSNLRRNDRQQGKCWQWYRQETKKICQNPRKYPQLCTELTDNHEKCLEKLVGEQSDSEASVSVGKGSQLFCQNRHDTSKRLGHYRRSELCFQSNYQVTTEHYFSDLVYLSDRKENEDILQFIVNQTDLKHDFERDCRDKQTLHNLEEPTSTSEETPPANDEL